MLVDWHGEAAALVAAQRADELLEGGDMDGRAVWMRILNAANEMQRTDRGSETEH